ncbi:hypothetical protein TI03_02120, partial [Achromatium sp. WMS1]
PPPAPQQIDYLTLVHPTKDHYRFLLKKASLGKVKLDSKLFGVTNIQIDNFTDAPNVTNLPVRLHLQSEHGPKLDLTLKFESTSSIGKLTGDFSGIDISDLQRVLKSNQQLPFRSGTIIGTLQGSLDPDDMQLKVLIKMQDVQANPNKAIFGLNPDITRQVVAAVNNFNITLYINGAVNDPRVQIDARDLFATIRTSALAIGRQQVQSIIGNQLEKHQEVLPDGVADTIRAFGGFLKR